MSRWGVEEAAPQKSQLIHYLYSSNAIHVKMFRIQIHAVTAVLTRQHSDTRPHENGIEEQTKVCDVASIEITGY